jgi:hypothetical protein
MAGIEGRPTKPMSSCPTSAHADQVLGPELDDHDYLRQVELLARDVVHAASGEGWQTHSHTGISRTTAPCMVTTALDTTRRTLT